MKTKPIVTVKIKRSSDVTDFVRLGSILIVLVITAMVLSKAVFVQSTNIINLLNQYAILILIALGQFIVILSGGLDLSVGAIVAISSVIIVQYQDMGLFPAIILSLVVSLVIGLVNGSLVAFVKLPPFIVTMAMMQIVYSIAKVLSSGAPVYNSVGGEDINANLVGLYKDNLFGFSVPLIICIAAIILISIYMRTSNGRFIYAVGGNEETARMSGLPVKYVKISVFLISALLATVAGILFVARVGMGDPDTGQTLPLDSIATVTIGGGALTGGIGTVPGTIIGVLILSVLNNIMSLLQTPPTIQSGIEGIVILVAVYFNSLKKRL